LDVLASRCSSPKVECRISCQRTVTGTLAPLVGFVCLSEFQWQQRYRAYWVSEIPLRCYPNRRTEIQQPELNLEVSTPPPPCTVTVQRISSLRLWLPFRVSPIRHRKRPGADPRLYLKSPAPSKVWSPTAFSQQRGATLIRRDPNSSGYVAPSGFRTLSTLCSPRSLPDLFHPGPAHGVNPSRYSISWQCRTPFRTPQPSWDWR